MESDLSCNKVKTLLSAYFDDELSEKDTRNVENHLSKCAECSNDLNNINNLSTYFKNSGKRIFPSQHNVVKTVIDRVFNEKELTCNEVLEEVSAYHDGELSQKLHYLVDNHLRNCESCNLEYENLVKISKLIKLAYIEKVDLSLKNLK